MKRKKQAETGLWLMKYEKICNNIDDTKVLAEKFAELIKDNGCFATLYGEIGAGKTAFVKLVADALGVKEKVTSPSFVILNEYHTAQIPVYHFDLYRLENEGVKTILDELKEYSEGHQATFVEWAEFSNDEIPFNHIKINVVYVDDDLRKYSFEGFGDYNNKIVEGLAE